MIKIIATIGKNNELGKNNDLIWHFPSDFRFLKKLTEGKTIAIGRNTFNSLHKKLVKRKYLILTDVDILNENASNTQIFSNVYEFIRQCLLISESDDIFIIGGASIYKIFIGFTDEIYLTEIDCEADADVYFPHFDKSLFDIELLDFEEEYGIKYKHVRYYNRQTYDFSLNSINI